MTYIVSNPVTCESRSFDDPEAAARYIGRRKMRETSRETIAGGVYIRVSSASDVQPALFDLCGLNVGETLF